MAIDLRPALYFNEQARQLELEFPKAIGYYTLKARDIGAKYSSYKNRWVLPPYIMYLQATREAFPQLYLHESVVEWWRKYTEIGQDRTLAPYIGANGVHLYDFQNEAIHFVLNNPHPGSLIALSPGLGKTAVSLLAAQAKKAERLLVVAPLTLLSTWEDECEKWLGENKFWRLHRDGPVDTDAGWYLANYDTIVGRRSHFLKVRYDIVIVDESIMIKNRTTLRYKSMEILRGRTRKVWLLSGYPISRYADDLWTQLHLIDPGSFTSYWRFAERYCVTEQTVWGGGSKSVKGTREDRDIKADLSDVMFVRNQKDVLDLPEYITQLIKVEMKPEQRKAFTDVAKRFKTELANGHVLSMDAKIAQFTRLQQITSNLLTVGGADVSAKSDAIAEMVEANALEFPLLIWTHWQPTASALYRRLARFKQHSLGAIYGANSAVHEDVFRQYKDGSLDILICSIDIGKYGHTLTRTRTIIYHDITTDADAYVQSKQRVQRIGLEKAARLITLQVVKSTDQEIEANLAGKLPGIAEVSNSDLVKMLEAWI